MVTSKRLLSISKVHIRCQDFPVGPQVVRKVSSASASSVQVSHGRLRFDASQGSKFPSNRIKKSDQVGGLPQPAFARYYLCHLSVWQPPLQAPVLSRCYAVAQPYPESWGMEGEDESGMEEVVDGCRIEHGELWNGDVKVHYVECGDKLGELVVLIHGFPNFWYVWKNQFHALAEAGYHVVAPDLRGYNTSSKPKGILNYGRLPVVSDIVCLIDEFGPGRPAMVVGHDWGGMVTWSVAEDFPQKVKKVVVVNSPHASVFSQALRSNYRQMRRSWYFGFFQIPWLPEYMMIGRNSKGLRGVLNSHGIPLTDVERHVTAFLNKGAAEGSINYYRAGYRGYWAPSQHTRPVLDVPVDMIWGELDVYLGKELAVAPKGIIPNTVVKFLPKSSHWPMWDDPKQFNDVLLTSLAQHQTLADKGQRPKSADETTK